MPAKVAVVIHAGKRINVNVRTAEVAGGRSRRVAERRKQRGFFIELYTLHRRVAENDVGTGACHRIYAAGIEPAANPTYVVIMRQQTVKHLTVELRSEQRVSRPCGAVGIPESVGGVKRTVFDYGIRKRTVIKIEMRDMRRVGCAGILAHICRENVKSVKI